MGFTDAVKALYRNYAKFDGRAARSEFWWAFLYFLLIYIAQLITLVLNLGSLGTLLALVLSLVVLGTCIPMISVAVRRLHDYNKSGWFYLDARTALHAQAFFFSETVERKWSQRSGRVTLH